MDWENVQLETPNVIEKSLTKCKEHQHFLRGAYRRPENGKIYWIYLLNIDLIKKFSLWRKVKNKHWHVTVTVAIKKNVPTPKLTYLRVQSELEAYIHTLSSPDILFGRVYNVFCSVTAGSSTGLSLSHRTEKSSAQYWIWTWSFLGRSMALPDRTRLAITVWSLNQPYLRIATAWPRTRRHSHSKEAFEWIRNQSL